MFWRKGPKKPTGNGKKPEPPPGVWVQCPSCKESFYRKQLDQNWWVCPRCGHHLRMPAKRYVELLLDKGFEREIAPGLTSQDPLGFPDYPKKLAASQKKTGLPEAAIAGVGKLSGYPVVLFVTDFGFMGGSMASVVGEKFYRAASLAVQLGYPLVSVTASGGGARMQEGIISLMQMVKTTIGVLQLERARLPYINVLSDPTMGGVMASFAALGDVLIAEPGALLGFAGPRVIQQTIKQELPPGFQRAEFQLEHGQVDMVVDRHHMKGTIARILRVLVGEPAS